MFEIIEPCLQLPKPISSPLVRSTVTRVEMFQEPLLNGMIILLLFFSVTEALVSCVIISWSFIYHG